MQYEHRKMCNNGKSICEYLQISMLKYCCLDENQDRNFPELTEYVAK